MNQNVVKHILHTGTPLLIGIQSWMIITDSKKLAKFLHNITLKDVSFDTSNFIGAFTANLTIMALFHMKHVSIWYCLHVSTI